MCGSPGAPVYSGVRDKLFGASGEWSFSRCSNADCGLLWLDPRPHEDDIHQAYATYYTHASPDETRSLNTRFLSASFRMLTRSVILVSGLAKQRQNISDMHLNELRPGRLLDIGCGDGRFLHRMKDRGWSVTGLDFDQQAARAAKEKYDIEVKVCRLEEMGCPGNSFDAITMNHVIEHVFDPVATLREVCRILKPGGMVVVVTPNADSLGLRIYGPNWRGLEPPRHIQIFSPQALERAARKAGLASVQVYSSAANAWTVLSASMQLAEQKAARFGMPQKPSIRMLFKALLMTFREAWFNAWTRRDGEENVLRARKDIVAS
jgi:2-polyprenyl-3-methyl-5-hydroxy-6-metoxy-1,4-benzoquinol methylase